MFDPFFLHDVVGSGEHVCFPSIVQLLPVYKKIIKLGVSKLTSSVNISKSLKDLAFIHSSVYAMPILELSLPVFLPVLKIDNWTK